MEEILLSKEPNVAAQQNKGLLPLARAIQRASKSKIAFTFGKIRLGDYTEEQLRAHDIDTAQAETLLSEIIQLPVREGNYSLETLFSLKQKGLSAKESLQEIYNTQLSFVSEDIVSHVESRLLKVFLIGGGGSGVVSAVQDMVTAFCSAGYYGRAFPLFDPSKKGAPVRGYGIVSREPILSHAPFEAPDIILLFDAKMFPLLREHLSEYTFDHPEDLAILVNTPMDPASFRKAADFHEPHLLFTVDAGAILRGKRIPPNYALIGGMLGILGKEAVDIDSFVQVVKTSLENKFGEGDKVTHNIDALMQAQKLVRGEKKHARAGNALGQTTVSELPEGQTLLCEDGNRAISRAVSSVLNMFPSVVAAYPITPQTQIVEYLAQMIADGTLSAEGVTPESEHGAGGAVMGAARDRVLAFTATCSQGFALMSEIIHCVSGMRMGNVVISNVMRSLNSPLDVENDHGDLYKIGLDAGFIVFVTRDVQQAYDFHLMAYLVGMYAEYKNHAEGTLEMIPDRSVMLPVIVASEGFEVSHGPERYFLADDELVKKFYSDPAFQYIKTFVDSSNQSIMGALQLSNARFDTDYQRHLAMKLAYKEVIKNVFIKFSEYTGRAYDFIDAYNTDESEVIFVVAGAANGTFEEVAREFKKKGINVGVTHPNVLRPFPKKEWADMLKGKKVFVYDRDDPFGSVGGRLYTELSGVVNEFGIAQTGTKLFSRIYGLGGRTPSLSFVCNEITKALKNQRDEIKLSQEKQYAGVNI